LPASQATRDTIEEIVRYVLNAVIRLIVAELPKNIPIPTIRFDGLDMYGVQSGTEFGLLRPSLAPDGNLLVLRTDFGVTRMGAIIE
jgi:hypothetical protein